MQSNIRSTAVAHGVQHTGSSARWGDQTAVIGGQSPFQLRHPAQLKITWTRVEGMAAEPQTRRAIIAEDGELFCGIDGCDVRRQPERETLVIRASSTTYSAVIAQQGKRDRFSRAIGHNGPMNGEHSKNEHARVDDRHLFRIVAWLEQASPPHWRGWVWHIDPHARVVLKQSPFDGIEAAFDIIRDRLGAKPLPRNDDG